MNDYNFFEDYKVKKAPKSKSYRFVNIIFLVVLIGLASYVALNYFILNTMTAQLDKMSDELLVLKTSDTYIRVLEKDVLLTEINTLSTAIENAGESIELSSYINENLLAVIADAMPSDVSLSSYIIAGDGITLSGTALNKPSIAEYEYRLRNIELVDNIFINSISRDSGEAVEGITQNASYSFTMSLTLGGGNNEN